MSSLDNKTISRFMKLASLDDSQVAKYISSEIKSSLITEGSADDDNIQGKENGRDLLKGEEEPSKNKNKPGPHINRPTDKDKNEEEAVAEGQPLDTGKTVLNPDDLDEQLRKQIDQILTEQGWPGTPGAPPWLPSTPPLGTPGGYGTPMGYTPIDPTPKGPGLMSRAGTALRSAAPYAKAALASPLGKAAVVGTAIHSAGDYLDPEEGQRGGLMPGQTHPAPTGEDPDYWGEWDKGFVPSTEDADYALDLIPGQAGGERGAQRTPLNRNLSGGDRFAGKTGGYQGSSFNWGALDDAAFMANIPEKHHPHGPSWDEEWYKRDHDREMAAKMGVRDPYPSMGPPLTGVDVVVHPEDLLPTGHSAAGVAYLPDAGEPAAMAAEEAISSPAAIAAEEVPAPEDWTRSSGRQRKARILSHPDAVMSDPTTWRPEDREGFKSWYRSAKARRQDRELAKQQAAELAAVPRTIAGERVAYDETPDELDLHTATTAAETLRAKRAADLAAKGYKYGFGQTVTGMPFDRPVATRTASLKESNTIRNMVRDSILTEISVDIGEKLPPSIEENGGDCPEGPNKAKCEAARAKNRDKNRGKQGTEPREGQIKEEDGALPRWGSEKSGPFSNAIHEEQGIFAPSHYCAHHVRENASGREGHVVEHNWSETLQEVTKYDVQFENELVEGIPASDLTILEASLAKEHAGHMAKRDDDEPLEEEAVEETIEETETLNEWKSRRLGEALFKKFIK